MEEARELERREAIRARYGVLEAGAVLDPDAHAPVVE